MAWLRKRLPLRGCQRKGGSLKVCLRSSATPGVRGMSSVRGRSSKTRKDREVKRPPPWQLVQKRKARVKDVKPIQKGVDHEQKFDMQAVLVWGGVNLLAKTRM